MKRTGSTGKTGISIITCTKRPGMMRNLFQNYLRQRGVNKELIVVLNNDAMSEARYKNYARSFPNVSVYKLPGRTSLGACLNFAASKAHYPYLAKFDDDDYYAPRYAADTLRAFAQSKAAVVGKRSYFMYFSGLRLLILLYPGNEHRMTGGIAGGTLAFRRSVWNRVRFANRSLGEDVAFLRNCRRLGFRIYSGSRFHYCAIRRKNVGSHTWKAGHRYLLSRPHRRIARTVNYRKFVVG
ncbi:glycosyltransferase involved in cell wall biosynthesis [Brevibacillus aydinogluensis]|uniref:glycosyltransferase family 2 protein n=1 Tax=Brevibacillus aydinogluensis TaxID=927786 RepID=UPI002892CE9A|nr:glycosyltransferase [Brevibacillus aydinogluensis]MDT3416046.1 glycosyltransferase involved in cell wall biosynthesis [Brevibacillus aydinogluensis]